MVSVGAIAALPGCAGHRYHASGGGGNEYHAPTGSDGRVRRPRTIPPGEKMNVACIGIAGKGQSDTLALANENVVALCDVHQDPKRLQKVLEAFPKAKFYTDYRKMLDEMDEQIDAVTVSTPDHTHFPAAMKAISMGKHAYVQKPLTRTIWEARQLTLAARRHGVATQMGNQHHASEGPRFLMEWLAAGAIGDVTEVHVWTNRPIWPQGIGRPEEKMGVPGALDWNKWLGTAPERPYHEAYVPFKWRGWWDYGSGALGDMGCHIIDAPFWALDLGHPDRIEAETAPFNSETFPEWSIATYQFPKRGSKPPVKMRWYDGGKLPPRPKELEADRELNPGGGQIYIGTKGVILADSHCDSPRIIPEAKMREFMRDAPPKTLPRSPGHVKEWVLACKGGKPAMSNFNYSGPLTEVVLMGNLAARYGKKIHLDQQTLTVQGIPEARDYIKPTYREF